jgi:hypothetical protein
MEQQETSMKTAMEKMTALKAEIPVAFQQSKNNYSSKLEAMRPELENTFKNTLNDGFKMMFILVAAANVLALLVLVPYAAKTGRKREQE